MPALPMAGFAPHDDDFVLVETLIAEQRLDEPGEVAVYRQAVERLLAAAARGDEAVAPIRAAVRPGQPRDGACGPPLPPTG